MIEIDELQNIEIVPKTEATATTYNNNLRYFLTYLNASEKEVLTLSPVKITACIYQYMKHCLDKQKLSTATTLNRYHAIKFWLISKAVKNVDFERLQKTLPTRVPKKIDRLPTYEEIERLEAVCKFQGKCLFHLMLESGMRIGAVPELSLNRDFKPIDEEICQITVYRGTKDEYITFCSIQTYNMLKELYDKHKTSKHNKDKLFPTYHGLTHILKRGWKNTGVPIEFSANHFCRKWFKTKSEESSVKSLYVELLLGHSIGLGEIYTKPTAKELAEIYRTILPFVTIHRDLSTHKSQVEEIHTLKKEIARLKDENQPKKIEEQGKQIEELRMWNKKTEYTMGMMVMVEKLTRHVFEKHKGKFDTKCEGCWEWVRQRQEMFKQLEKYLTPEELEIRKTYTTPGEIDTKKVVGLMWKQKERRAHVMGEHKEAKEEK